MRKVPGIMDRLAWLRRVAGGAALLSLVAVATPAKAGLILDLDAGGVSANTNAQTIGWAFDVTTPIRIKGLALWDDDSDGFGTRLHPVGLFVVSIPSMPGITAGTIIRSATIDSSDTPLPSASTEGRWLFELVAPITLPVGRYALGAGGNFMASGDPFRRDQPNTTIPQVTFVECRFLSGSGYPATVCPTSPDFTPGAFGPNLLLASEPVSLAVLGLGLSALGLMARRRRTVASR